jgi:hypothetical protein
MQFSANHKPNLQKICDCAETFHQFVVVSKLQQQAASASAGLSRSLVAGLLG